MVFMPALRHQLTSVGKAMLLAGLCALFTLGVVGFIRHQNSLRVSIADMPPLEQLTTTCVPSSASRVVVFRAGGDVFEFDCSTGGKTLDGIQLAATMDSHKPVDGSVVLLTLDSYAKPTSWLVRRFSASPQFHLTPLLEASVEGLQASGLRGPVAFNSSTLCFFRLFSTAASVAREGTLRAFGDPAEGPFELHFIRAQDEQKSADFLPVHFESLYDVHLTGGEHIVVCGVPMTEAKDPNAKSVLVAFNHRSGEEAWSIPVPESIGKGTEFARPQIASDPSTKVVALYGRQGCILVDLYTGRTIRQIAWIEEMHPTCALLDLNRDVVAIGGDRVFVYRYSSGEFLGCVASENLKRIAELTAALRTKKPSLTTAFRAASISVKAMAITTDSKYLVAVTEDGEVFYRSVAHLAVR